MKPWREAGEGREPSVKRDDDPVERGHGGPPQATLQPVGGPPHGAVRRERPAPRRIRRAARRVPVARGRVAGSRSRAALVVGAGRDRDDRSRPSSASRGPWARGDYAAMYSELTAARRARPGRATRSPARYRAGRSTRRPPSRRAPAGRRAAGDGVPTSRSRVAHARLRARSAGSCACRCARRRPRDRLDARPRLPRACAAASTLHARTTRLPRRGDAARARRHAARRGRRRAPRRSALGRARSPARSAPIPAERARRLRGARRPVRRRPGRRQRARAGLRRPAARAARRRAARRRPRSLAARPVARRAPVRTTIATAVQTAAVAALAGRLGGVVAMRPAHGRDPRRSRASRSRGLQPPGSTFKIVTLTGGARGEARRARADAYPGRRPATLEGVELQNANGESCGGTLALSFAVSCNSVFAPLGAKLGARAARRDRPSASASTATPAIPGAATSTIPPAEEIGDDLAVGSSAIGQGRVQATALQMAIVAATIGLRGRARGRRSTSTAQPRTRQRCARHAPRTARTVERLMIAVVAQRHRHGGGDPRRAVAGKTGTAELKTTTRCQPDPANPDRARRSRPTTRPTPTRGSRPSPRRAPRASPSACCSSVGAGGRRRAGTTGRAGRARRPLAPAVKCGDSAIPRVALRRAASRTRRDRPGLDVEVDRRDLAGRGGRADRQLERAVLEVARRDLEEQQRALDGALARTGCPASGGSPWAASARRRGRRTSSPARS